MTDYYTLINYAVVINLIIFGSHAKRITEIHQSLSNNLKQFSAFAEMFDLINGNQFNSQQLKNTHSISLEASKEFKALTKLGNFFDQRTNVLVMFFLNAIFLFDIQCVFHLEKWKKKNKSRVQIWLNGIAEIETLSSLATFCFNHPGYIFPKVEDRQPYLKSKDLSHPLIPTEECVSNDITFGNDERLFIVTGSNMSGKSTFLRTIGVNVLLARCGAPVCAAQFECSVMDIYTSLRQTDSLLDHVSLFFSELRKLKSILHGLSTNPNALVLLDEVLRGTNSDDKLYGSQELVKKLIRTGCVTILATHDIALSKMTGEYPDTIKNYCFESSLDNNQLSFDYKLKSGVSQNRNATFLMKQMGIID
jgi:DNA mismatch repair ATPase MutS